MTDLIDTVWSLPRNMRAVTESEFYLSSSSIEDASPWTGERGVYGPYVQYWIANITPPSARSVKKAHDGEVTWRDWQGFVTRLRGTVGRVRMVDYYRMRPRFDAGNVSDGAWAGGAMWSDGQPWKVGGLPPYVTFADPVREGDDTAVLKGLPPSTEMVLSINDLCEGRPNGIPTPYGNLYELVTTVRSNSSGQARIYVQPGFRQRFAAGDMMVLREPTCVFRLADKDQGIVRRSMGNVGSLALKLVEHIRDV